MIPLSSEAELQLDGLLRHYERLERIEAARNLLGALTAASERIAAAPGLGLFAPRPYPALAHLGFHWIKEGAYWIVYSNAGEGPIIAGIFHEAADIPNRL